LTIVDGALSKVQARNEPTDSLVISIQRNFRSRHSTGFTDDFVGNTRQR